MIRRIALLLALLAGCIGWGCGSSPDLSPDTSWALIEGANWQVAVLEGQPPIEDTIITLRFQLDGSFEGVAGVNRFFGRYERGENRSIRILNFGITEMFRDKPRGIMAQEQRFTALLGKIDSWSFDGNALTLSSLSKPSLNLTRQSW